MNRIINDCDNFSQSYFRDVKPIHPEKYPDYICNYMSIRTYNSTLPCTNHFKFYRISKPFFYQKRLDRLYEKAINLKLRDIIGDPHFRFICSHRPKRKMILVLFLFTDGVVHVKIEDHFCIVL